MNSENEFYRPIRNLQIMLRAISIVKGEECRVSPDGIYGAETTDAVSKFQRSHDILVTGAVNEATWNAVVQEYLIAKEIISSPYPLIIPVQAGAILPSDEENSNVAIMQCILQNVANAFKCISPLPINGKLDEPTCIGIKQFQRMCDLPVTGKMDPVTWKHLALCYPIAFSCHSS